MAANGLQTWIDAGLTLTASTFSCSDTFGRCILAEAMLTATGLPGVKQMEWRELETFSFGDSPDLADELAGLVLAGVKRATCWAASDGLLTDVGKRMVMLSGSRRPLAVLETIELSQRRFNEVDAAFAYEEGEGDRTLAFWQSAHRAYFGRRDQFEEDMLLYCERFRLVELVEEPANGCIGR